MMMMMMMIIIIIIVIIIIIIIIIIYLFVSFVFWQARVCDLSEEEVQAIRDKEKAV